MRSDVVLDQNVLMGMDSRLLGRVRSSVKKLSDDWRSPGLHVEPIEQAYDDRVRTARVNQQYRMVLFHLRKSPKDLFYVEGVYNHDDAYDVAGSKFLRVNDITGQLEVRDAPAARTQRLISESERKAEEAALAARLQAERERAEAARRESERSGTPRDPVPEEDTRPSTVPTGPVLTVTEDDLVQHLGLDPDIAARAVEADEDQLLALAAEAPSWQGSALLDLATGKSLEEVRQEYSTGVSGGTATDVPTGSDDVVEAIRSDAARGRFVLLEDDAEFADVLERGDLEAWHVFLHPDQRRYVEMTTGGPFRLSGGAGTGKTVVLVHRAVRLARSEPRARIVLTTYTRGLAESVARQLRSLAPDHTVAKHPGDAGIYVGGIDQISWYVVNRSRHKHAAMTDVIGWGVNTMPHNGRPAVAWDAAIRDAGAELPEHLRSRHFFETEYAEIVLPQRIRTEREYMRAGRAGRGTKLGRHQRAAVWAVISRYRDEGMREEQIDWDELSAIAGRILEKEAESTGEHLVDHVLIDESQDARPTHWQMFRALVAEGKDDLFIADDAHQRIYGNRVVLKRYGINVVGRSRRLLLNYRTTAENLRFALAVLRDGDYSISEAEGGEFDAGEGSYRSARSGPAPVLIRAKNLTEEYDQIAELVRQWVTELDEEGLDPSSLGILTHMKSRSASLVAALGERGVRVRSIDRNAPTEGLPLVMTLHTSKGMEFTRVILFGMGAETIPSNRRGMDYDEDALHQFQQRERSLLYVGATRARDYLAVTWNDEPSEYITPAIEGLTDEEE
ncbi:UvrD-helicase domain-containing protein [Brachybacterium sp. p3-SID957]|uniref:UvrD-helicase domain-containing protein n=1 Tax=Brachybacterium sp. p3-SID957 TaxID=2916049 RepID=UPI00223AFFCA|nr:UvrD-helicase domain-containing protein [Brachybacterium sp. p3-SID957]MCT1774488.1 UvrD-helicase domain-containing protein [Brachybacterium sp. p3-SID957]